MSTPGNGIATRPAPLSGLVIKPGQETFNEKQKAGLAVLGIKDCSDAELAVFMHYCQKTQLDPFSRQIYYIGRRNKEKWQDDRGQWQEQWVTKWTIQVGIGGFQVIHDRIAQRLGLTVEYEDTIWYDGDGGQHGVWLWDYPPAAAKVVVLKDGKRYPGVCRTASYMQLTKGGEPAGQWKTQPDHMIEKCAEAFALRRAFPHDLGGIYIPEEVQPAGGPGDPAPAAVRITAEDITTRRPPRQQRTRDDWAEQPGKMAARLDVPLPPDEPADPRGDGAERPPARASSGQVGIIRTAFSKLGYEDHDREERLVFTARLAGVPDDLESTKDLTEAQARTAIGRLNGIKDRAGLLAAATRIEQDASGEATDG